MPVAVARSQASTALTGGAETEVIGVILPPSPTADTWFYVAGSIVTSRPAGTSAASIKARILSRKLSMFDLQQQTFAYSNPQVAGQIFGIAQGVSQFWQGGSGIEDTHFVSDLILVPKGTSAYRAVLYVTAGASGVNLLGGLSPVRSNILQFKVPAG